MIEMEKLRCSDMKSEAWQTLEQANNRIEHLQEDMDKIMKTATFHFSLQGMQLRWDYLDKHRMREGVSNPRSPDIEPNVGRIPRTKCR